MAAIDSMRATDVWLAQILNQAHQQLMATPVWCDGAKRVLTLFGAVMANTVTRACIGVCTGAPCRGGASARRNGARVTWAAAGAQVHEYEVDAEAGRDGGRVRSAAKRPRPVSKPSTPQTMERLGDAGPQIEGPSMALPASLADGHDGGGDGGSGGGGAETAAFLREMSEEMAAGEAAAAAADRANMPPPPPPPPSSEVQEAAAEAGSVARQDGGPEGGERSGGRRDGGRHQYAVNSRGARARQKARRRRDEQRRDDGGDA